MNYKLLALDIDGTLLDSQSGLTERVILAVPLYGRTTWKHCTPSRCRRRMSTPYSVSCGKRTSLFSLLGTLRCLLMSSVR